MRKESDAGQGREEARAGEKKRRRRKKRGGESRKECNG